MLNIECMLKTTLKFSSNVLPVISEILVDLNNIESPLNWFIVITIVVFKLLYYIHMYWLIKYVYTNKGGHFVLPPLASSRVCFLNSFWYIQNPVWFNSQDLILFKKYHDLSSTTSCEVAAVVFVRNSPEYTTPWTQSESNSATY